LKISTLGRFALAAGGRGLAVEKWHRKQALTLLKFLVTHLGHAIHREVLIEQLWPEVDEGHGRERLKVTVYFLRQQLRAAGIEEEVVETVGKAYALRRDAVRVDADIFEKLVADGIALQRQQRWDEALHCYEEAQLLYRGDYMEEDIYADWCAEQRERLREIDLEMLTGMAQCYAERDRYAEAAQVCRTALVRDPYREGFHRALMRYLIHLGHTDSAVAQYHRCERVLARELGVEPMPETQRLYRQILEQAAGERVQKLPAVAAINAPIRRLPDAIAVGSKGAE
jgi:DNA-binding SARP family transcriptional activator